MKHKPNNNPRSRNAGFSCRWFNRVLMPAILLAACSAAITAGGQGFMVRPTRIDAEMRPGRTSQVEISIRNTTPEAQIMDLSMTELSQTPQGSWRLIETEDEQAADLSGHASLLPWAELDSAVVEIDAHETKTAVLSLNVPPGARGWYFGAVTAQSRPQPDREGISLVLRFAIPVIVQIQGRPVRQQVNLEDLALIYREAGSESAATTLAKMQIGNQGLTYSRIRGDLRVEKRQGERWRPISRTEITERGIIPGVTLELGENLRRRLPSGNYRLRGQLYVDGRRMAPLEKEIEFAGDPEVETLALDTILRMEPEQVEIRAMPGATRTTVVRVENPAEEALLVKADVAIPASLQGVVMGELRGEMLSAAHWVEVRPAEFTIRPEGRQNLRVISRIPRENVDYAAYYADLILDAHYLDGQSAGTTRSMVTVDNRRKVSNPRVAVERLTLSRDEEDNYIVQGRFTNLGDIHVEPSIEVELRGLGAQSVIRPRVGSDNTLMLPMASRQFAGIVDFTSLQYGRYSLQVEVRQADVRLGSNQISLLVEEGGEW